MKKVLLATWALRDRLVYTKSTFLMKSAVCYTKCQDEDLLYNSVTHMSFVWVNRHDNRVNGHTNFED